MVGTGSEWLLAICFQIYILSFAIELRHAYCHAPKLKLIAIYDDSVLSVESNDSIGCCGAFGSRKERSSRISIVDIQLGKTNSFDANSLPKIVDAV